MVIPQKPRKLQGTPSIRYRNYYATAVLLTGVISGLLFVNLPFVSTIRTKAEKDFFTKTEEEVERRYLMGLFSKKTKTQIESLIDEKDFFEK